MQKDLGGALKELEKGLNQQGNIQNNNSKPKLENNDKAVAKIINNLCVITYTASNGKKFERKSTAVNDCERDRRSFLLNDAKQIEKDIAYNKRMKKERKEREIQQAKQREEERKRQQAEKQKRIDAAKKKEAKLQSQKKNKDTRGQWGVSFNNTQNDLKAKKCYVIFAPNMNCKNEDGVTTYVMMGKDGFPYKFYRNYGSYSSTGLSKYNSKLKERYKVIKSPTTVEREKFIYGKTDLVYYYQNTKANSKKPLYISLFTQKSMGGKRSIYIGYFSKNYFEKTILSAQRKQKKKDDDL